MNGAIRRFDPVQRRCCLRWLVGDSFRETSSGKSFGVNVANLGRAVRAPDLSSTSQVKNQNGFRFDLDCGLLFQGMRPETTQHAESAGESSEKSFPNHEKVLIISPTDGNAGSGTWRG